MAKTRKTLLSRFFFRGIAALLPTLLTGYIVFRIGAFVNNNLGQPINGFIAHYTGIEEGRIAAWFLGDAIGILLVLIICMFVGFLLTSFLGRRLFSAMDDSLARIPLLKAIYPPIKQVTDFFLSDADRSFGRVVVIEYPRKGLYSLGFLTGNAMKDVPEAIEKSFVNVFIPSSPTPMTGYVIMLPVKDVYPVDITVDEALRLTISGGVLIPPEQRRPDVSSGELPEPAPPNEPPKGNEE